MRLEPGADSLLSARLSSKNPETLNAVIQAFALRKGVQAETVETLCNLAVTTPFEVVIKEALSICLDLTQLDKKKQESILHVLSREEPWAIKSVLDIMQTEKVSSQLLVDKLVNVFSSHREIEIKSGAIGALGQIGELSALALANIAIDLFYKPSQLLFPSLNSPKIMPNWNEASEGGGCNVVSTESIENNKGAPLWLLRPNNCKVVGEEDPEAALPIEYCSDPTAGIQLATALRNAINKTGAKGVEHLATKLNSSNPIYRALVYSTAVLYKDTNMDIYRSILAAADKKEHLWNQVYLISIASTVDLKLGKEKLDQLLSDKMFSNCMSNPSFADHYRSLGSNLLE